MANGKWNGSWVKGEKSSGNMDKNKKTEAKKRGMTKKDWAAFFAAT